MARETKTAAELNAMIQEYAAKHSECAGCLLPQATPHAPDASGCNWSLGLVSRCTDEAACNSALQTFTDELRARLNLAA